MYLITSDLYSLKRSEQFGIQNHNCPLGVKPQKHLSLPLTRMLIRSERISASCIEWSVRIMDLFFFNFSIKVQTFCRTFRSRPVVGSSRKIIFGFPWQQLQETVFFSFLRWSSQLWSAFLLTDLQIQNESIFWSTSLEEIPWASQTIEDAQQSSPSREYRGGDKPNVPSWLHRVLLLSGCLSAYQGLEVVVRTQIPVRYLLGWSCLSVMRGVGSFFSISTEMFHKANTVCLW